MCSSNGKLQLTIFLVLLIQFAPEAASSSNVIIIEKLCPTKSHRLEGSQKIKSQREAGEEVLPSKRKERDWTTTIKKQKCFRKFLNFLRKNILKPFKNSLVSVIDNYCCWPFSPAEPELHDPMPEIWSSPPGPVSYDVLTASSQTINI